MDLEDFTGKELEFQRKQQRCFRNWEWKDKCHSRRDTKLYESYHARDGERLMLV